MADSDSNGKVSRSVRAQMDEAVTPALYEIRNALGVLTSGTSYVRSAIAELEPRWQGTESSTSDEGAEVVQELREALTDIDGAAHRLSETIQAIEAATRLDKDAPTIEHAVRHGSELAIHATKLIGGVNVDYREISAKANLAVPPAVAVTAVAAALSALAHKLADTNHSSGISIHVTQEYPAALLVIFHRGALTDTQLSGVMDELSSNYTEEERVALAMRHDTLVLTLPTC